MRQSIPLTSVSIMNLFFMLGTSMILAVDQDMFERSDSSIYDFFLKVAPQITYSAIAFILSIIFFAAFLFRNKWLEIVGLFFSGIYLLMILAGYLLTFPSIGAVAFAILTLASFMTIVEVLNAIDDDSKYGYKGGDK